MPFSVGYKYCDIKPTMRWSGEQHKKQRVFTFSLKFGFWVVGDALDYLLCAQQSALIDRYKFSENIYLIHPFINDCDRHKTSN